ncbi:MAG: hypothetical protein EOO38_15645 [Cytophagaceae bacterium]|nr:MAG: hypothetical protein EOO38_15645 [Cytophagaceae bacterium]
MVESAPTQCHCSMVVQETPVKSRPSHSISFTAPLHLDFVVVPAVHFDVPREVALTGPLEARGPPLQTACLTHPSLRAPPIA